MLTHPTDDSTHRAHGGVLDGTPVCEFGHQGLMHDETLGLVFNRARVLHPTLGRFMQRDPLGYVDAIRMGAHVGAIRSVWTTRGLAACG